MPTQRSAKQCRERWCYNVRPGLKKGDWSSEEDKTILTMHGILGNQWARIASALSGRTDSDVKNRINSLKRARANQVLLALPPLPADLECNGSFTDSSGSNSLCDSNPLTKKMKNNFSNENLFPHRQLNTSMESQRNNLYEYHTLMSTENSTMSLPEQSFQRQSESSQTTTREDYCENLNLLPVPSHPYLFYDPTHPSVKQMAIIKRLGLI